jgi:hypothetical protein
VEDCCATATGELTALERLAVLLASPSTFAGLPTIAKSERRGG